jgi:hypothetical protein
MSEEAQFTHSTFFPLSLLLIFFEAVNFGSEFDDFFFLFLPCDCWHDREVD